MPLINSAIMLAMNTALSNTLTPLTSSTFRLHEIKAEDESPSRYRPVSDFSRGRRERQQRKNLCWVNQMPGNALLGYNQVGLDQREQDQRIQTGSDTEDESQYSRDIRASTRSQG